jgi:spore maturation protein CgeB
MTGSNRIAFYGSSLLSSYWNGAATYYRGIIKALADLGWDVTFYEPDVWDRQQNRDIDPPDWASVSVWPGTAEGLLSAAACAGEADVVVVASGIGYEDGRVLEAVMQRARPEALLIWWDVDAPATLAMLREHPDHPLHDWLPDLDMVLSYGGGQPVIDAYRALGARHCEPVYNALDPEIHHPVAPDPRFSASLAFLANRLPDREARVTEFFFAPAGRLPEDRFLLGGSGWDSAQVPPNVAVLGHVGTAQHNAFNCTPRMVLNVARDSMASNGFSPATRVFEAAGAAACIITDDWAGIEMFLQPGQEILVARDGRDVEDFLRTQALNPRLIGAAAQRRVLAEHTYVHRARQVDAILVRAREEAVA